MTDTLPTSTTELSPNAKGGHVRRFLTDALAGLGLFALGMVMTSGSSALAATLTLDASTGVAAGGYASCCAAGRPFSRCCSP